MFRFAAPWLLLLLPAVVAAAAWRSRRGRRSEARLELPLAAEWIRLGATRWTRLERALPWLRAGVLALVVAALARPQSGARIENVSSLGIDIVLAVDVSGSMRAEDFQPKNRLEVARRTVDAFVEGRPSDRLGLVAFAAVASTRCPLTLDHAMLRQFLKELDFAPREQDGTAIGLGLATALNRLRDSQARSKVVVLVTDGRNNRGQIGPKAAAEAARALEARVYTIGVGSDGEVPFPVDYGPLGVRYTRQRIDLDEDLLREIAQSTGGRYFRATDAEGLRQVFATIDELEKSEIESRVRTIYSELFPLLLGPTALLLLLERLLVATRLRRIP
jgi:Ca-activated chloride channel family protein